MSVGLTFVLLPNHPVSYIIIHHQQGLALTRQPFMHTTSFNRCWPVPGSREGWDRIVTGSNTGKWLFSGQLVLLSVTLFCYFTFCALIYVKPPLVPFYVDSSCLHMKQRSLRQQGRQAKGLWCGSACIKWHQLRRKQHHPFGGQEKLRCWTACWITLSRYLWMLTWHFLTRKSEWTPLTQCSLTGGEMLEPPMEMAEACSMTAISKVH